MLPDGRSVFRRYSHNVLGLPFFRAAGDVVFDDALPRVYARGGTAPAPLVV